MSVEITKFSRSEQRVERAKLREPQVRSLEYMGKPQGIACGCASSCSSGCYYPGAYYIGYSTGSVTGFTI